MGRRSDGIEVRRCRRCGMGVVAEHPADLLAEYHDGYYGGSSESAAGYEEYRAVAAHSLPWAADLVRLLLPAGRVLDVGAADGTLLRLLDGGRYERHAIEVNERLLDALAREGIRPVGRDLLDPGLAAHGGAYDAITAIAVLEHLPDIRQGLERIRDLLAPNAFVLYEVPLLAAGDEDAVWYGSSLEHVFYPTLEGLDHLARAVFGQPLLGRHLRIRGYGSTFLGLATPSAERHEQLAGRLAALLDTPVAALATPLERTFRFDLELVHAADPSPETIALLPEMLSRVDGDLLSRLAALWRVDRDRARSDQLVSERSLQAAADREASLAARLEDAAGERLRLEGTLAEHVAYLESVRADLATESSRAARLRADLAAETERGRRLEEELSAKVASREAEIAGLHAALAGREADIERLGAALAGREEEIERGRRQAAMLEAAIDAARARTVELENLQSEAAARAQVVDGEVVRLRRELTAIHSSRLWRTAVRYWRVRERLLAAVDGLRRRGAAALRGSGRALAGGLGLSPRGVLWGPARAAFRRLPVSSASKDRWMRRLLGVGYAGATAALPAPAAARRPSQEPWPAGSPLVTVVIPCFNYGRFLADAVDSVLAQTWQDLEILVVEGGSTSEESLAAARALRRPKTTVLFRDARYPCGDNRNYGIARARGKYVCCLDADDQLRPTFLEKALFLVETGGFDVVSTSIESWGAESRVYPLRHKPTLADMLEGNHVSTCALFRRDLWERAGGFQDAGHGPDYVYEDWRLFQRMSALGARICNVVQEPLLYYRVHHDSQSAAHRSVEANNHQRQAIRRFNDDVISDEALTRSERLAAERLEVADALVNLVPRACGDGRPTILLALPFLLVGGAERLLGEVVRHLTSSGCRVLVVTTLDVDPAFGDATPWFAASTAEVYHLPRFLEPERWDTFVDYLLESRRPAVLWIVGSAWFYERLPRLRARHPGIRVADLLFNTSGHTANNRRYRDHIDLNLVENREVEDWLLAAGESASRIRRIESGVDLETYRPLPRDPARRAELGIPEDAFVAGFSGRWSLEKAPEIFLEVSERLIRHERIHFVMTGAGPLAGQIEARARGAGANPRLHLLGQVSDVRTALAVYDVLLVPSRLDGRPVVVLESLAMGIPVVASRVGDLPRLVRDGETGLLCPPADAAAFAQRVLELAARPGLRDAMAEAARRHAEADLDAGRMVRRYMDALADLGVRPAPAAAATERPFSA